jgi:hypothetical protein
MMLTHAEVAKRSHSELFQVNSTRYRRCIGDSISREDIRNILTVYQSLKHLPVPVELQEKIAVDIGRTFPQYAVFHQENMYPFIYIPILTEILDKQVLNPC